MTNEEERFGQSGEQKFHHKEHREHEDRTKKANLIPLPLYSTPTYPWLLVFMSLCLCGKYAVSLTRPAAPLMSGRPIGR